MISARLLDVVRCPDCGGEIKGAAEAYQCNGCGRIFQGGGYLDLHPLEEFREKTKYLDHALHADARHETIAPPLLGSRIRNDMLRKFLKLQRGDTVIDLGCGSGRTLAWNAGSGASLAGIDIAPFFAAETLATADLMLGDLRRLPIRDEAFAKAWSLDVLEHLSRPALIAMLKEANRVLTPNGALFVYTHVRKNGPLGGGVRMMNRLAAFCERLGLLDLKQERLRKSDHLNPIADHEDLDRVADECGFVIERKTFYTPIVGAFVENVLVRMAEKQLARRSKTAEATRDDDGSAAVRDARRKAQQQVKKGGVLYRSLVGVSWVMKSDVALLGRVRSGPFFALLRKTRSVS